MSGLQLIIVPIRVGMQFVTLCVTSLYRSAHSTGDAERLEMHSHAKREERDLTLLRTREEREAVIDPLLLLHLPIRQCATCFLGVGHYADALLLKKLADGVFQSWMHQVVP